MKAIGETLREKLGFVDQDTFQTRALEYADRLNASGVDNQVIEYEMRAVYGGPCSRCGKEWREVRVDNAFGRFTYFEPICTCELNDSEIARRSERIHGLLAAIGVPYTFANVSFATWDTNVDKRINAAKQEVVNWTDSGDWMNGAGLILFGGVGTGKTRCAVSVVREIVRKYPGKRITFISMANLLGEIIRHKGGSELTREIAEYDVIVIDDVDKVASEREWARSQVFGLFDAIYRERRSVIVTTNMDSIQTMRDKLGESVVSRWIERCRMVEFPVGAGSDYRYR